MASQLRETEAGTKSVRRIIRKQTEKALEALGGNGRALSDEAVHDTRKRLKKVRAALRLVRKALGARTFDRENAAFRDAARPLTEVRDAKILVETLDKLAKQFEGQVKKRPLDGVRRALRDYQKEVRRTVLGDGSVVGSVRQSQEEALARVEKWALGGRGWSVLGDGLRRVYRGGRQALAAAEADPSVENLHEWRKQVKYLWHQLEILQPLWGAVLEELADQAHALGDLLGDDHDLAVLRDKLEGEPERFPDRAGVEALVALIDRRRAELQEQAWPLGRRLYGEKPRAFVDRLHSYWRAWRAEDPDCVRAGSVSDRSN